MPFKDQSIVILAGRIVEIGARHVVLSPGTRIMLPAGQDPTLNVGDNVTVRAVRDRGQYVAESLTRD